MRLVLPALVLLLCACASSRSRRFEGIEGGLARPRTIQVASEGGGYGVGYLVERVAETLQPCVPGVSVFEGRVDGGADVSIVWDDDQDHFCLHYWAPSCDPHLVIVQVTSRFLTVRWSRSRPGWCLEPDCLLKEFLDDFRRAVCQASRKARTDLELDPPYR